MRYLYLLLLQTTFLLTGCDTEALKNNVAKLQEKQAPGTTSQSNILNFEKTAIKSYNNNYFILKDHVITDGQPFDGVTTQTDDYTLTVKAGRHGSREVDNYLALNWGFEANYRLLSAYAGDKHNDYWYLDDCSSCANWAIYGDLTFTDVKFNKNYSCPNIGIAQSYHEKVGSKDNDWIIFSNDIALNQTGSQYASLGKDSGNEHETTNIMCYNMSDNSEQIYQVYNQNSNDHSVYLEQINHSESESYTLADLNYDIAHAYNILSYNERMSLFGNGNLDLNKTGTDFYLFNGGVKEYTLTESGNSDEITDLEQFDGSSSVVLYSKLTNNSTITQPINTVSYNKSISTTIDSNTTVSYSSSLSAGIAPLGIGITGGMNYARTQNTGISTTSISTVTAPSISVTVPPMTTICVVDTFRSNLIQGHYKFSDTLTGDITGAAGILKLHNDSKLDGLDDFIRYGVDFGTVGSIPSAYEIFNRAYPDRSKLPFNIALDDDIKGVVMHGEGDFYGQDGATLFTEICVLPVAYTDMDCADFMSLGTNTCTPSSPQKTLKTINRTFTHKPITQ